jgi:ATP-dependent Lon protease
MMASVPSRSLSSHSALPPVPVSLERSRLAALPEEVVEKLDIVFYGDVDRALLKSIAL